MKKSVMGCGLVGRITGLVLLILAIYVPVQAQTDPARVGEVTIIEGSATVLRAGQTTPESLALGSSIYQNDTITTDTGQLRIKFADDSIVSVGSKSNLKINQYVYRPESQERVSSLDLLWGKVKCYVKDLTGFSRRTFDVTTPTAIIGVRGTTYIVDAPQGEGRTLAANIKGSVYAANVTSPSEEIGLPGETYTEVREGRRPDEPLALTPALLMTLHQGLLSMELGLTSAAAGGASAATTVPTVATLGGMVAARVAGLAAAVDNAGKKERDGDLYTVSIRSEGDSYSREFAHVEQIISEFRGKTIRNYLPNFNENTSPFTGVVDFRGLPMYLDVAANSNTFHLRIPDIGLDQSFTGSSRDDSLDALQDWMKNNNDDVLTKISKWCAKNTATDPVAGNPTSLMGRMVSGAFDGGFSNQVSALRANNMMAAEYKNRPGANQTLIAARDNTILAGRGGSSPTCDSNGQYCQAESFCSPTSAYEPEDRERTYYKNLWGLDAEFGWVHTDSVDGYYYTLPLSYSLRLWDDPRKMLTFKVPLGVSVYGGARTYTVGFGASFTWPVLDRWLITPEFQYGFVGSYEAASASQMLAGSITSAYTWDLPRDMKLSLGNMIGVARTLPAEYQGYNFDPDITAYYVRNGLLLTIPSNNLVAGSVFEPYFYDTRYLNNDIYVYAYDEIGVDFGLSRFYNVERFGRTLQATRDWRFGLSVLFGVHDTRSLKANMSFKF